MNKEFLSILGQLEREKGLDRNVLISAVKQALETAAKKIAKLSDSSSDEIKVEIDPVKGDIRVYIGDREIVSREFGRIAAQTARQIIIQKIREAEKENIYNEFKGKEGDIVGGVVYRLERKAVILDLMGRAEGIIPHSFLSPLDRFRLGERVKGYVREVKKDRGTQIIISRRHEGLVKKLFELEVPEILEGIVEIKSIAREAGERTKIAVFSKDEKVDCVGACVGIRGSRVKSVIEELRGEKIDIVRWSEDIKEFIKASLSPAVVSRIELDRDNKRVRILVANDQLSLAIGKKGQNVRLASRLVGWEIDIRSKEAIEEDVKKIQKLKSVGKKVAAVLVEARYNNLNAIAKACAADLAKLKGIGSKKAEQIIEEAKKICEEALSKEPKDEKGQKEK
ncbi:MAG: transcription termination/antitermination protein NusA [Candidatus Omnitrophota bacterium]|nr:MAG: transcription termination/antitermination protein NusA [Candidatus Omnitrophota bacterium]